MLFLQQSILFGALLSLLIGLREFAGPRFTFKSVMDIILFVSGGIVLFYVWMFMSENVSAVNLVNHMYLPFLYSTGPATYFGYYSVVDPNFTLKRKYLLAFVPTLLLLAALPVGFVFFPDLYAHRPMDYFSGKPLTALEYLALLGGFSNLIYYLPMFLSGSLLFRFSGLRARIMAVGLVITNFTLTGVVILYLVAFAKRDSYWLYLGVAVLAYLNILYEIGRRYNPELFEQLKQAIEKQRVSRLAGLDLKKLHFELIDLMTADKLYMDAKLTLAKLAEELDVKPHQLSEFLNKRMQTNFNRFINQFRIEKVVKLIMEDPSLNILDVAFTCGFSSKTAFNTAFVNLKGMPPGRYIELKREQWSSVSSKS